MTLRTLRDRVAPTINWARYMGAVLPRAVVDKAFGGGSSGDNSSLLESAEIRVASVDTIRQFERLARSLPNQAHIFE